VSLPVTQAKLASLLRRVPFGAAIAPRRKTDGISGYSLVLSMPSWLNELLGNALQPRLIDELQLIEAHELVYLQFLDDALDGQSQMGRGDPDRAHDAARQRLARLFHRHDPFWEDYRRLEREQRASARWEARRRRGPMPAFDAALFRAIAAKGALLRWPASAIARLANRAATRERLDSLFNRFLGVLLLLDDVADVEEDAQAGRINTVLCAGRVPSRDPLEFYPFACRGAQIVCAKARTELARLFRAAPSSSGFAAACAKLIDRCNATARDFRLRCQWRTAQHIFATIAARAAPSASR
jgi:hypothetical protein